MLRAKRWSRRELIWSTAQATSEHAHAAGTTGANARCCPLRIGAGSVRPFKRGKI